MASRNGVNGIHSFTNPSIRDARTFIGEKEKTQCVAVNTVRVIEVNTAYAMNFNHEKTKTISLHNGYQIKIVAINCVNNVKISINNLLNQTSKIISLHNGYQIKIVAINCVKNVKISINNLLKQTSKLQIVNVISSALPRIKPLEWAWKKMRK